MKITARTKNNSLIWNENLRIKCLDVVLHSGNFYQNTSGINTNPVQVEEGWVYLGSVTPIKQFNLNIASKGAGNTLPIIQPGDVVYGLLNDGSTFLPFCKYIGLESGGIQNIENYEGNPIQF